MNIARIRPVATRAPVSFVLYTAALAVALAVVLAVVLAESARVTIQARQSQTLNFTAYGASGKVVREAIGGEDSVHGLQLRVVGGEVGAAATGDAVAL